MFGTICSFTVNERTVLTATVAVSPFRQNVSHRATHSDIKMCVVTTHIHEVTGVGFVDGGGAVGSSADAQEIVERGRFDAFGVDL